MNGILQKQNQQRCFNPKHPELTNFTPKELHNYLRKVGCCGCELGSQQGLFGPVVCCGNPSSRKMLIGEAPGKDEDTQGIPFVGPAGVLLYKIFESVKWNLYTDWYLGNVVKCRPIAKDITYKQNFTPTSVHHKSCRPYIEQEIRYIKPHTIVLLGKTATISLVPDLKNEPMNKMAGRIYTVDKWPETVFFVMYHPAALLHAQKYPDKYQELRQATWKHINSLRELVEEQEHLL